MPQLKNIKTAHMFSKKQLTCFRKHKNSSHVFEIVYHLKIPLG